MMLPERPTRFRWVVFFLGCATSWMLYLHRYAFGLIKPKLQDELQLSNTELGLLDSAFFLFYTWCQVPSGILMDLWGAHLFLGLSIIVWSVAMALHAGVTSVNALWYVRAGFGASQAGAYAGLARITRTWFPESVRTTAQGWIGIFSGRMGGACANLLFATLLIGILHLAWQEAVYVISSAGILLGISFLLLFRNSPWRHPFVNSAEARLITGTDSDITSAADGEASPPKRKLPVRELLRRMSPRSILNLFALSNQAMLSTLADAIYVSWIPFYLNDVHSLNYKAMGIYSALPLIGGALGGAFGGWLNDFVIRRSGNRRWSRSGVGFVGKGLAGTVLLFAVTVYYHDPYTFCGLLFLVKFFSDWSLPASWGTVTDISGPASATVFSINNFLASSGAIIGPALYGYQSDHYGWPAVFGTVCGVYFLCAVSWLLVNCTIPLVGEE